VAVVMAALGQASGASARSADERQCIRRQSPYGVAETVQRIEESARQRGMAVLALFEPGARVGTSIELGVATQVIVLESSQGGTPVLMADDTPEQMEVPLSVTVREAGEGRTEVLIGAMSRWDAMLHALASDLDDLSAVVGDALQAGALGSA
jgi:uncharacterized protein (DUF302 family)